MPTSKQTKPKDNPRFSAKSSSGGGPKRDRSKRLLDLVMLLLQSRIPVTFREIRSQFTDYQTANDEAGLRAFERDKSDLLELGVPIRYVTPEEDDTLEDGGYVVELKSYRLPEVRLSKEEVSALLLASSVAQAAPGGTYPKIVDLAVKKLAFDVPELADTPSQFPPEYSQVESKQQVLFHFPSADGGDAKTRRKAGDLFAQLENATRLRKRLTIEYVSASSGKPAKRQVDPYGLVYQQGVWLVVGYCHLREGVRSFRLDRIRELKVAPKPKSPDFERPEGFDVREYAARSPWTYEQAQPEWVTLEFDPHAADVLSEDFGPKVEKTKAGEKTRVRFLCSNPDYAVSRILGAKGHIRLLEGVSIRTMLRDELLSMREVYQ